MSNIYSKGDIMDWDESEYNYFMHLDDVTKVYYLHDYLYGELELDEDEPWVDFELDEDDISYLEDSEKSRKVAVDVIIDDTTFIIKCPNRTVLENTVRMFMMDGFILEYLDSNGDDVMIYNLIGHSNPVSMN